MSSPKSNANRTLALVWTAAAIVMAVVVVWAAVQVNDPLEDYVGTDKTRHILAFGAIGLCAGLMPAVRLRLIALGAVLTLAVFVELIQMPIPDRTASVSDLFASTVGAFGGFGLGAAALNVWAVVTRAKERSKSASPPR